MASGPAACGQPSSDTAATDEPVEVDSATAFLSGHWQRPIPAQGEAPSDYAPIVADLEPEACATCHPAQLRDWSTSFHARAFSPGLVGQLVAWFESAPATAQSCMTCHGPLTEQLRRVARPDGVYIENVGYDPSLEAAGVLCAACHVRAWQPYGPPRRDGSTDPAPEGTPHQGAIRHAEFESSRFCAACHQFEAPAPNGKPLENTLREWEASDYADQGVTCQQCHMPDRRHLWRGIHDPEMTRSGVTPEWKVGERSESDDFEVQLRLTNSGTGHHFPTYVTPAIDLEITFIDGDGETLTTHQRTLKRDVFFNGSEWVERADSRIPAGESQSLEWSGPAPPGSWLVIGRVVVRPDAFYTGVFQTLLNGQLSDEARSLLEEALAGSLESPYELLRWETRLP